MKRSHSLATERAIKNRGGCGILTAADIPDISEAMKRVLWLMADSNWHSTAEINAAAGENGIPAGRGLARLWDLKRHGYEYEKEKAPGTRRVWRYRLTMRRQKPPHQLSFLAQK